MFSFCFIFNLYKTSLWPCFIFQRMIITEALIPQALGHILYPSEQSSKISMNKVRKVTHEHKLFQFLCWNIPIHYTYFINYTQQKLELNQKKVSTIAISNYMFGRINRRAWLFFLSHSTWSFRTCSHIVIRVLNKHTNACFIYSKYWLEDKIWYTYSCSPGWECPWVEEYQTVNLIRPSGHASIADSLVWFNKHTDRSFQIM